jgi:hypothetical protein
MINLLLMLYYLTVSELCYPSGDRMEMVPNIDTIYTRFHPSSGLTPRIILLEDYNRKSFPDLVPDSCPWEPFRTQIDFEALELAMEIGFNQNQLVHHISILHRVQNQATNHVKEDKFMVQSAKEAMSLWDLATHHHVKVRTLFFVHALFIHSASVLIVQNNNNLSPIWKRTRATSI